MPFISNTERQSRAKKLFKGSASKKTFILLNTIITLVYLAYVIISVSVTLSVTLNDLEWKSFMSFFSLAKNDNNVNVWILLIGGCVAGLLQVIALFVSASMKSAKAISKETIALASSAVAGKKKSGNAAADFRDRIEADNEKVNKKAKK